MNKLPSVPSTPPQAPPVPPEVVEAKKPFHPRAVLVGLLILLFFITMALLLRPQINKLLSGKSRNPVESPPTQVVQPKISDAQEVYEDQFLSFQSTLQSGWNIAKDFHEGEEGGQIGVFPRYRLLTINYNNPPMEGLWRWGSLSLLPVAEFTPVDWGGRNIRNLKTILADYNYGQTPLIDDQALEPTRTGGQVALPYLPPANASQSTRMALAWVPFKNGKGLRYITTYNQDASPHGSGDILYVFQGLTDDGLTYVSFEFALFSPYFDQTKEASDQRHSEVWAQEESVEAGNAAWNAIFETYLQDLTTWVEANLNNNQITPNISDLDALVESLLVK